MQTSDAARRRATVGLIGLLFLACGGGESETPAADDTALLADPRIAPLFGDCKRNAYYDRFVDDIVPILIEKLMVAGGEPLKRAKEELGELGEASTDELRRVVDQSFANAFLGPHIENALDAASLNPAPGARLILLRALDHPMETVRQRGMLGLVSRHALPEDFDAFLARFEGTEPDGLRRLYLRAMFVADRARAEDASVRWLRNEEYLPFWIDFLPLLSESTRAETATACSDLYDGRLPHQGAWIATPPARSGDERAIAYLVDLLDAELPQTRLAGVRALADAGLVAELVTPMRDDPDETVRVFAIDGLVQPGNVDDETRERLQPSLGDGSPVVRAQALRELCRLGDPEALDRALGDLGDNARLLSDALQALRDPLEDPEVSRRAFEELLGRHRLEELRPVQERTATFKAMGLIQLPEAAAFLREQALAAEGEVIEGLRAHDWMMIQASNTGPSGRTYLWSELEDERDPERRLDLISAVASTRSMDERPAIRERLLSLCEGDARNRYELVYAADRAAKLGPAVVVAPRLKVVCNAVDDTTTQLALQCLLWRWY